MRILAALALAFGFVSAALPAAARDSYVMDGAGLFGQSTVSALNAKIGAFATQTGKEVVVVTVPSLDGRTARDAAERAFAQNQVNGVMIFLAKAEKQDLVVPDRAARAFFPPGETANIHQAMRGYFRSGDFDGGITTGVNLVLGQYQSHLGSLHRTSQTAPLANPAPEQSVRTGGFGMSWIWLILILVAAFLILRALFRALAGPRMYPPGYGPGGPGFGGGPGYGGPGYGGPGYGYGGGGGGSFWSGLLGGLGGAFIGNELFGRGPGWGGGGEVGSAGFVQQPGDSYQQQDAQGWQSDAGQADMSNAGGGDWGGGYDSGGGGDWGGGGGGFDAGGGGDGGGGGW